MTASFRAFVPPYDHPRRQFLGLDFRAYSDVMLQIPFVTQLAAEFRGGLGAPFAGITTDGHPIDGLFAIADEGAPAEAMVRAAQAMLQLTSPVERATVLLPLDDRQRRQWSNPEISIFRHGLRLEEVSSALREAILDVMRASLSDYGYHKARDCMIMNAFLGEVVDAPASSTNSATISPCSASPRRPSPGAGICTDTTSRSTCLCWVAKWS